MSKVIKAAGLAGRAVPWSPPAVAGAGTALLPERLPAPADSDQAAARARADQRRAEAYLAETEQEAARLIDEARTAAAELLRHAEEGAQAVLAEARRLGRTEGEAEAAALVAADRAAAGRETAALRSKAEAEARALIARAGAERERILAGLDDEIVGLAMAVAARVVRSELAVRPAAVVPMVAAALDKLRGEERVRVRAHPDWLPTLAGSRATLQATAAVSCLDLEPEPGLGEGDFVVEGSGARVDGRVEQQVAFLNSAINAEQRHPEG